MVARMRCHYAFARARNFTREAAACPLYLRGIAIEAAAGSHGIDIVGSSAELARQIQQRSREEVVYAPAAGRRSKR
jgi:hypothetical protein